MKPGHFFWISGWLWASTVLAQPLTVTNVVAIPNKNTLAKPDTVYPPSNRPQIEPLALTYQQNNFFIYFRAPGIPPPYAFRLKGYLTNEIRTADQRVFFTNIPNGNYEFSVRAVARPDLPPARLSLRIESPIWLRWWFLPMLFGYSMGLVGVIFYFLYRYRLRQFMRLHALRENIARDLHDDMGSYLSSISIWSQSVLNLTQTDPAKAHALVDKIGETARQVMDSMGDIIWSVNPDNDSMAQIGSRLRDVGTDLLEERAVVFSVDVDETLLNSHLPLEQRRDVFLIYKEALTNIARYAQASHVWVRLERQEAALLLTIQDDGVGFNPQQPVGQNPLGGNGLKNMRARAETMGATLSIESALGQGTTLTLQLNLS